MVFPCSSQLHSLLTSQSCTEGVTGGIQPSSPQPLSGGELNMQTHILSVAWQKHSLKQGRCPQKKAKEKKKVLPLEKQLDIASWRGGKMFQPPSLQSCFCSLEYAFQGGSSSISPTPEHRQICWIFLSTSAKNKRYPLVHKFITRCWWCQRLHGSGVGHLEQTLCISSSH